MKHGLGRLWVALLLIAASFAQPRACCAQEGKGDLADMAARVAKAIAKAKIGSVAVASLAKSDGAPSMEGHYLAQELAQGIGQDKHIRVIDPSKVMPVLASAGVAVRELGAGNSLEKIQNALAAEAIVTGIVEIETDHYTVKVTARSLKDASVIAEDKETLKRPSYTDALVFLDPTGTVVRVARPGENGIDVPKCVACPGPIYADQKPKPKMPGKVVLEIVIDEQGAVPRVALVSTTDKALIDRAVAAVRKWKFKPATDKSGKTVAVMAPVEITLDLY